MFPLPPIFTHFQPYFCPLASSLIFCSRVGPLDRWACFGWLGWWLAWGVWLAYLCPWLGFGLFNLVEVVLIFGTYLYPFNFIFKLIFGTYLYPFKLVGVWAYFLGLIYNHSTSFSSLFLGLIFCSRGRGLAYSTWMGWCLFLGFTFGLIVVSMI